MDAGAAEAALRIQVGRVVALLRSASRPDAPALGSWSVAEVAMHLSQVWLLVQGLADEDLSPVRALLPGVQAGAGPSLIRDIGDHAGVTTTGVRTDPERGLRVLADRIEAQAEAYLTGPWAAGPDDRAWLVEGVRVGRATLTCHLLNEVIVHGWDIARAEGAPWPIDPAHAVLVMDGFLVPLIQSLGPRDLVDQDAAAGLVATYDLRVRGGSRYRFAYHDGELTVGPPSSRPVDCHVSADPAALLLVIWGRRSQWPAIASGRLLAWGRRPWLGFRMSSLVRRI